MLLKHGSAKRRNNRYAGAVVGVSRDVQSFFSVLVRKRRPAGDDAMCAVVSVYTLRCVFKVSAGGIEEELR